MGYHNLREDKSGRWTRKQSIKFLVGSLLVLSILAPYTFLEVTKANAEVVVETATIPSLNCMKIGEREYQCGKPEDITKWKNFLADEIKKLEAEKPVKKSATVTMYTSRAAETDDSPCIAANGKDICQLLAQGVQSCASNDYKMGTKLQIEGLGECIIMDRMNRRYTGTGRIDWYGGFDLARARQHGVKQLLVAVIK